MADTNDDVTQDDTTQDDVQGNAQDDSIAGDNVGGDTSGNGVSDNASGGASDDTGGVQGEPQDNIDTNSNPPPVAVCSICIHVRDVSSKIATGAQREMTIGEALRMLPKHPTNFKTLANARMLAENVKPALPAQVCLHTGNMDSDPMTGNAICRSCTVFNRYGECALFETAEETQQEMPNTPSEPSDDTLGDVSDATSGGDDTGGNDTTGGDGGGVGGGDTGDNTGDNTSSGDGNNTDDNTGNTPAPGDNTSGGADDSGASDNTGDTTNS